MLSTISQNQKISDNSFNQKIFWFNELSKEITETNFLTDYVRTLESDRNQNYINFQLSDDLAKQIIHLTDGSDLSIYLFLFANLNVLLHKYTGNSDIIIGSPIYPSLDREEFTHQIIPVRLNVKNQNNFKDLLCTIKEKLIAAYCNSPYPLEQLIEFLNLPQDSQRNPLFDIVISLENIHNSRFLTETYTDLHISFVVRDHSIQGKVNYNQSLFKQATIENIIQTYLNLIEATINNINITVADIPLVKEEQKSLLLGNYHQNHRSYPVEQTISQLFEQQVELTPNRTAAVFEHNTINYQKINESANQVARYLIELGVNQGSFVGIIKKRDINFLIAILAILKAGGVYVPIDSTYPPERIKHMLLNSETKIVLSDASCLETLADVAENCQQLESLVCLDIKPNDRVFPTLEKINIYDKLDFESFPTNNLDIKIDGKDQAYMIYTSGSTGLPKGAIIRHGGAINHIYAQYEALKLPENLVFLQSAPASSDISVWQFLAPILIGGKTVIVDTETVCQPEKLFQLIQQEKITIIELVPVVLKSLLDYISQISHQERLLPDLKWMMVTGESATVELVNNWLNFYPFIPVVNAYGPTEAADDITQFIIDQPLPENQRTVPIGKPLANLHLYILDQQMQLLPVGFPGEICVSGFGVGAGYWKNQVSTKSSFIPNLFSSTVKPLPGTSTDFIYKTGDLGRWLPDGNIEFLGRIDHQVKIRGFRIELGEIETVLSQHPLVRENVVLLREDLPNYKRLVAYIVPSVEDHQLIAQLRDLLKEKLPEYMIPSAFVMLEKLPLAPSGKIDRKALPLPDSQDADLAATFVAPRTTVEETLVEIWEQVLGINRVGIYDNFFELGGDSILCIQVIAKARQAELDITPKQLFQNQTIAELAKIISTSQAIPAEQGLVTGIVALTPIQHYFFEQNLLNLHHWNEAVLLELLEPIKPQLLEQVVQQLLIHHDALRLRFEQTESGWQQINLAPEDISFFSYIDLSQFSPEVQLAALEKAAIDTQTSLNLSQRPLVKVVLFNLGAGQNSRLLVVIHHLLVDSLSWRILIEDLQAAYQQLIQGEEIIKLPAKTTSFKQWSQHLQEYANSELIQQELSYWLTESRQQVSPIPVDYPGGANTEALATTVSVTLSVAETQALLKEVPVIYRTQINEILLTGLVQAFYQWTGKKSLLVDLEGHGREDIGDEVNLSRTVGLFSSIYPVLLNLGESSEPKESLKAIKEQLRNIPNRGIGYGLLRYLNNDMAVIESLKSLPTAEVVFNYLGQFDQTLSESSLFRLAHESIGPQSSLENNRRYLISFNSFIVGHQLQLNCTYSQDIYQRTTIAALCEEFLQVLRSLIADCQSGDVNALTPSDFPLAQLSQDDLDAALAMVEF